MTWCSCLSVNSQQPLNWKRFLLQKFSKLHLILIQLKSDNSRATVFDIKKKSRQYNSLDRRRTSNITMETNLVICSILSLIALFFGFYVSFHFSFENIITRTISMLCNIKKKLKFLLPAQSRLADNKKSFLLIWIWMSEHYCCKWYIEEQLAMYNPSNTSTCCQMNIEVRKVKSIKLIKWTKIDRIGGKFNFRWATLKSN